MRFALLLALVAGCGFHPTTLGLELTDADAGSDVATTCGVTCPWGCIESGSPHCGQLVPAGGAVGSGDFTGTMSANVMTTIDTGDGNGMKPEIDGTAWADYRQVDGITIFHVKAITFTAGMIEVKGKLGLAIVATGAVTIDGVIDATVNCDAASLVGGHLGGTPHMPGTGLGAGSAISGDNEAGGGGGNGGTGGDGGGGNTGGSAFGASDLVIAQLDGGGGGGGGNGNGGPAGGDGGAAIQIVSNVNIAIAGTGGINAGGCGGFGSGDHSGGGGGAGGTILLEAPHVTVAGKLAVNGGGGGAGVGATSLRNGSAGTLDRIPAGGGMGAVPGASGAAASILVGGTGSSAAGASSGGGGGIGRIRIETVDGMASTSGTSSPGLGDSPTTCTLATAMVQ